MLVPPSAVSRVSALLIWSFFAVTRDWVVKACTAETCDLFKHSKSTYEFSHTHTECLIQSRIFSSMCFVSRPLQLWHFEGNWTWKHGCHSPVTFWQDQCGPISGTFPDSCANRYQVVVLKYESWDHEIMLSLSNLGNCFKRVKTVSGFRTGGRLTSSQSKQQYLQICALWSGRVKYMYTHKHNVCARVRACVCVYIYISIKLQCDC